MNKSFHSIWNASKQTYVAAAETVSAKGKPSSGAKVVSAIAAVLGSLLAQSAYAQTAPPPNTLPKGGQVSAGQAQINTSGANMVILQGSDRAAINWQTFNVGKDAKVQFQQPSANSVTLNRVMSSDPSQIFGRISANGQVILTNPAGVYFGKDARLDVGGLVATTHSMSNADFLAGKNRFERNGSTASVVNEGEIKSALGGYIALLAPEVRNQGAIIAQMGTVALAAGEAIDLKFDSNNRLTSIRVEPSQIQALVENRHAVQAPGGLIILSAQSMDRLVGGVVKNSGTVEATGLQQQGGRIILSASKKIDNAGSISANATADGPAGKIEIGAPVVVNSGTISAAAPQPSAVAAAQAAPLTPANNAGSVQIQATTFAQSESGRIDVSAPLQGGTLNIHATGQVQLKGQVDVSAKAAAPAPDSTAPSQGGQIEVSAGGDIEVNNASLDASGAQGGRIHLRAAAPEQPSNPQPLPDAPGQGRLAIIGNSVLSVRGRSGQGGRASLLGDHIDLIDTTHIDASGATGGGTVLVGGDWQGSNGVYQATSVTMSAGASIDASATQQGDGGTVVLWSDIHRSGGVTSARGEISARGGALGGDGGRVETSGHELQVEGISVDAGSPRGKAGMWLLDPYDYIINAAAAASIGSALNSSDVTVTTQVRVPDYGSGTNPNGSGEIRLLANIAKTATQGTTTLTLQAHRRIEMNGLGITSAAGGPLNVVLWANFGGAASGSSTAGGVSALSNISTNGGFVWVGGGSATTTNLGVTVPNGPSVGGINANHNPIDWNGAINTAGGEVFIWSGMGFNNNWLAAYTGASINAGSGDVTIRARNFNWISGGSPVVTTTGRIVIRPDVDGGSFEGAINTDWFNTSGAVPTSFQFGAPGNTATLNLNRAFNVNGPVSVYGGDINIDANLRSTQAGAAILFKSTGGITQAASTSVTTTGGHLTYWSDSDNNRTGSIHFKGANSLSTAGGNITLAGGLDNGSGAPAGYATQIYSWADLNVLSGGVGGGDITMRANSSATNLIGAYFVGATNIDADTGRIVIDARSDTGTALAFQAGLTMTSASTGGSAISISGIANNSAYGAVFNNTQTKVVQSTGTGSIDISGQGTVNGVYLDTTHILSASGAININTTGGGSGTLGISSTTTVLGRALPWISSSSSAVNITANQLSYGASTSGLSFQTSGAVSIQSSSASFTNALDASKLTYASSLSGLTLGKTTNTQDITLGSAVSISGPISVYGGNVAINAKLQSTTAGAGLLVKATGSINVSANTSLRTNAGNVVLWSDSDANGTGYVQMLKNSSITTAGGGIVMGGGTDLSTGYARGESSRDTETDPTNTLYIGGVHLRSGVTLNSGGGDILLRGQNSGGSNSAISVGVFGNGTVIDAGTGRIAIDGYATGSSNLNAQAISTYNGMTLRSASTSAQAVSLVGDATGTSGSVTSLGVNFAETCSWNLGKNNYLLRCAKTRKSLFDMFA